MFVFIRLIIGGAIGLVWFVLMNNKTVNKRKNIIISFVIAVIICLSYLWPFENYFITFDSPKTAYEYYVGPKDSDIKLIIEGKNSDLIISTQNQYTVIPKTNEGWKIGVGTDLKTVTQKIVDGVVIYVHQYRNTNDYYISVFDTNGEECDVADIYKSEFISSMEHYAPSKTTVVTHYANIQEFNGEYWIRINDNEVRFSE